MPAKPAVGIRVLDLQLVSGLRPCRLLPETKTRKSCEDPRRIGYELSRQRRGSIRGLSETGGSKTLESWTTLAPQASKPTGFTQRLMKHSN